MKILGLDGMGSQQLEFEIQQGGKFVIYQYCISILIMTFKRSSDIYFLRAGESSISKGLSFSAISFFIGWWGFPWGPIYTISTLVTNFKGGKDVTQEVVSSLRQ